jgi:hypothetical protein
MEKEVEDLVKQEVVFDYLAFFCMSLYTSIMVTFQEPVHEVISLKRNHQIRYPPSGDPSSEQWKSVGTSPQQHLNLHLLVH